MIQAYDQAAGGKSVAFLKVIVPGCEDCAEILAKTDIVAMHGKDFSVDLPPTANNYRKIIQVFPGELVPTDGINRVTCCSVLPPSQFE